MLGSFSPAREASVLVGNLDGVHAGHRELVRETTSTARRLNLSALALVFDPHPAAVVAPARAPQLLTSVARRRELLLALGMDEVVALAFTQQVATLEPRAFVKTILADGLRARVLVVGTDFRFGRGRSGDLGELRTLGSVHGIDVVAVGDVVVSGARVSSTRIRTLLASGDVETAAKLLGRVHDVDGKVLRGDGRGRTLGFATANLEVGDAVMPADGIYAIAARRLNSPVLFGVVNLGVRPTFDAGRSVEAHLFDFDQTIYDEVLRVGFIARLRPELKFDSVEALRSQITADAAAARERCARVDPRWLAAL